MSEEVELEGRSYIPLGFSNEPGLGGEGLGYLLRPDDIKRLNLILKKKENPLLSIDGAFFGGINFKEKGEGEAFTSMRNNLIFMKKGMNILNNNFKTFWGGWYYNYSIPSISKEIFNKFFNNFEVNLDLKTELDERIRPAYMGGRCEIFGNPKRDELIYHFDFNNMYGQVMLQDYPTGELVYEERPKKIDRQGFYFICGKSFKMYIPILPIKENIDNFGNITHKIDPNTENSGLFFPNGEFSGLYYSEEVELFLKEGGIVEKIEYAWIYTKKKKPLFREFSEKIMDLRKEGDPVLWKKILVSFYGRLGMVPKDTLSLLGTRYNYVDKMSNKDIRKEVWFGEFFIAEVKTEPLKNTSSRVDYAAIITSKARIKLWLKMKEIIGVGGRILYCDTDSIFFTLEKKNEGAVDNIE